MPAGQSFHADMIVHNGVIWCGMAEGVVDALAIWQGKVLATGTRQEMETYRGDRTELLDLQGQFATPASTMRICISFPSA